MNTPRGLSRKNFPTKRVALVVLLASLGVWQAMRDSGETGEKWISWKNSVNIAGSGIAWSNGGEGSGDGSSDGNDKKKYTSFSNWEIFQPNRFTEIIGLFAWAKQTRFIEESGGRSRESCVRRLESKRRT